MKKKEKNQQQEHHLFSFAKCSAIPHRPGNKVNPIFKGALSQFSFAQTQTSREVLIGPQTNGKAIVDEGFRSISTCFEGRALIAT